MKNHWKIIAYALELFIVVFLDRITKYWAIIHVCLPVTYTYNKLCISSDFVYNRGISWGLLHEQSSHQFIIITGIVTIITLLVALHAIKWFGKQRSIVGHILILAGSLSNIMDRYWYGGVIDFIGIRYREWSWAIFNVADVAIVAGALIIFLSSWRDEYVVTHN